MDVMHAIKEKPEIQSYELVDLMDQYGNSVYRFCRSLTYSREDADDLFQETFLKVFEQLHKVGSKDPQSFLFSNALFIWKSWKRKYARRKRLAPMETLNETIVSQSNVENDFIDKEELQMVRGLVDSLADKFKIPMILYYTVEMCVDEIASVLSIPSGTVKSRLYKGRKMVEKGLVAKHYEESN